MTLYFGDGTTITTAPTGGKVVQMVSSTKTGTFTSTTRDAWLDVGLNVTITPTSSSNKVYVMAISRMSVSNHATSRVARGSTGIGIGDADGNRTRSSFGESYHLGNQYRSMDSPMYYLDSPNTTSAITYKVQSWAGEDTYFNRTKYDTNGMGVCRPASTITVWEIAT